MTVCPLPPSRTMTSSPTRCTCIPSAVTFNEAVLATKVWPQSVVPVSPNLTTPSSLALTVDEQVTQCPVNVREL